MRESGNRSFPTTTKLGQSASSTWHPHVSNEVVEFLPVERRGVDRAILQPLNLPRNVPDPRVLRGMRLRKEDRFTGDLSEEE